jgi:histidyl-tRNA synthetase
MQNLDLSPPSGTRDFFAEDVKLREKVFGAVKEVFESFGFLPLETPAFEKLDILTSKYGDEGEKLIFKILKRGEKAASGEADLALRYDLTVPLARVIAQYPEKTGAIFKRYQLAPVWRADRPGKLRYREFYQCDIDIAGTSSLLADAEVVLALSEALRALGIKDFFFRYNSRKVLKGIMQVYKVPQNLASDVLTALDKLDKVGLPGVSKELLELEIPADIVGQITDDMSSPVVENRIRRRLQESEIGQAGLTEVDQILSLVSAVLPDARVLFDPFIARGLSYYTGPIFEIFTSQSKSAIASGGRYDELVGMFSKKDVPACGGSLGIERILALLRETDRPTTSIPQVLVTVWNDEFKADALLIAVDLRSRKISAEVYLGEGNIGRQLRYASNKNIPFCVLYGPDEKLKGEVAVKNLGTASQNVIVRKDVGDFLESEIKILRGEGAK